jgi:hypothetical protein
MADGTRAIIASLVIVVALMVGLVIVDALAQSRSGSADSRIERDAAVFGASYDGDYVAVNDVVGTDETVYKTTGYTVRFTGADDSELSADGPTLGNDTNWHLSVWGNVDSGAGADTMQLAAVSDGEVRIVYDGASNEWLVFYYRQDTRNSYNATVATSGSEVGNFTNIQAGANDTHLRIWRNNTLGQTVSITGDSTATARSPSNWDGRVEELRQFESVANTTLRSSLVSEPVEQRPSTNRTARVMFDAPYDQDALVLFANADGTLSNASRVRSGFARQVMQPKNASNELAGTTDYAFDQDGPSIKITSSAMGASELDGAPVAYVSYDRPAVATPLAQLTSWFNVAAVLPLVLIAAAIIARLR